MHYVANPFPFLNVRALFSRANTPQAFNELARSMDTDGSGFIEQEEFSRAFADPELERRIRTLAGAHAMAAEDGPTGSGGGPFASLKALGKAGDVPDAVRSHDRKLAREKAAAEAGNQGVFGKIKGIFGGGGGGGKGGGDDDGGGNDDGEDPLVTLESTVAANDLKLFEVKLDKVRATTKVWDSTGTVGASHKVMGVKPQQQEPRHYFQGLAPKMVSQALFGLPQVAFHVPLFPGLLDGYDKTNR